MRHAQRCSQTIKPALVIATLMLLCLPAQAHETDQYTLAPDRELADVGDYLTRYFYNAIERGVNKANARIRSAIQSGAKGQELARLQSADEVTRAVNREFPYAIVLIEGLDGEFTSPRIRARYPGMLPAYKPPPSLAKYIAFPLNPMRAWNCASLKVFGVQLGTDKIGHFTDMGMHYYNAFHAARTRGESEDRAVQRAIDIGRNDPFRGESALLGFWTAGAYSNADMAINYLGLVFYRNLTEPQMLKGQLRPPMLLREADYWRIAPHVRPDSDFLRWFISDHADEALNPSLYLPTMRDGFARLIRENAEGVLEQHRDRWGNRRSQAWWAEQSRQLRTYWGVDYGHAGREEELLLVSRILFEPPRDPTRRDRVGRTALHRAVAFDDLEAVEQLLNGGADINEPVRSDESFNSNWGDTPLHMAVQDGREQLVKLLIARGADVNRANDRGNTPLHRAVEYPKIMQILLDAGARLDAADALGRTPLHWAAMLPDSPAGAMLLQRGADPNARDIDGQSPMHYAARCGATELIAALAARGGDGSARDSFGATPLHVACASRQLQAVKALLSSGAVANVVDDFGRAPLHDAARLGDAPIVAALLGAGADPAVADAAGNTPLHLACRYGQDQAAVELVSRGASLAARAGASRRTPLDEAQLAGHRSLAAQLAKRQNGLDRGDGSGRGYN